MLELETFGKLRGSPPQVKGWRGRELTGAVRTPAHHRQPSQSSRR